MLTIVSLLELYLVFIHGGGGEEEVIVVGFMFHHHLTRDQWERSLKV